MLCSSRFQTKGKKVGQEAIKKEITDQLNRLVAAINDLNADAWSSYYSKDDFVSAIASTDYYATRSAWVSQITHCFSMQERQSVQPVEVRVNPLTSDLALMTSEEDAEMWLPGGEAL
jgi:hypothetical protein